MSPKYDSQEDKNDAQPLPVVIHPVKKFEQSKSVIVVLGASEHIYSLQVVDHTQIPVFP